MPGHLAGVHTCGFSLLFDPDFRNSKCIVIWGIDVENSYRANFYRPINEALADGAKLIVIDPIRSSLAEKADIYLQVRPGTDCALALSMINVIINEELYDIEFVEKWTEGFDELKKHVQKYPPQKVSEICWVPEDKIVEAARLYAKNRPGAIGTGSGGLCQNTNTFQTNRAIAILVSIVGNLDIKGGHINHPLILKDKGTMMAQYDMAFGDLKKEQIKKRLGIGKIVEADGLMNAHPERVWKAIREKTPYPIRAILGIATNSVITKENSKYVRDTLLKLDFFAISDLFMTPTTEIADIVLPAVHWSERDEVIDAYTKNFIFCHRKIVDPPDECWEDKKILVELAKRLGMDGFFKSVKECLDDRLKRLGMNFEQFCEKGIIERPIVYKKFEQFGGFKTRSKKVELYSKSLENLGVAPLPEFFEPPESPISSKELAKRYPLILITGIKTRAYFHSSFRNIERLRRLSPFPFLLIHPKTADERGIKDGDWVEIESKRGIVKHKAKVTDSVDPRVVAAPHGWWYGYRDGWKEVNINVLTDGETYDQDVGSTPLKGLLCEVRKAASPPVEEK